MTAKTRAEFTAANRAAWNASAHLHEQGEGWEKMLCAASKPGFSVFDPCLTQSLTEVGIAGRRALQIGCNNARELLSLASFGAVPAAGVDQSAQFLDQARRLSEAAGLSPDLIEADIYDLSEGMGVFDLILITIGVLNWMPDLARFFEIVAGVMAPGAVLVIYETHPFLEMFDPSSERPFEPAFSYFEPGPFEVNEAISYDGKDHGAGETGYWFVHTLGEVVTGCVQAGLSIARLQEHGHSNREVEYDIYAGKGAQIPMCYTLVARRGAC